MFMQQERMRYVVITAAERSNRLKFMSTLFTRRRYILNLKKDMNRKIRSRPRQISSPPLSYKLNHIVPLNKNPLQP